MRAEALRDFKNINKRETSGKRRHLQAVVTDAAPKVADKPKRQIPRYVFVILASVLVTAAGIGLLRYYVASFVIEHVVIEGEFHNEQAQEIEQALKPHLLGDLFTVNLSAAHASLTRLPWVDDVRLQRAWPDKVIVKIQEQVPVARWNTDALINANGVIFNKAYGVDLNSLPALDGPENKAVDVLGFFRKIRPLLAQYNMSIAGLAVDERNSWSLVTQDKVAIRLGRQQIESRLKRFLVVMQSDRKADWSKIESVDLRHSNGFSVRWLGEQVNRQG